MDIYSNAIVECVEAFVFTVLLFEFLRSLVQKDNIYSLNGTFHNILRGLGLLFITNVVDDYYFGNFFVKFSLPNSFSSSPQVFDVIFCLIVLDFFYYLAHWLKHNIGFLWALHAVHHNDRSFNMSTYLRASWIERFFITSLPVVGVFFLGFSIWDIAIATFTSFAYQFFCHSQYLKLPHFLNLIFITPQLHRIHHDQEEKHQRSNFGAVFSIWDRLFGTYVDEISSFTPGIKGYQQDNFIKMEIDPIREYWKKVKHQLSGV